MTETDDLLLALRQANTLRETIGAKIARIDQTTVTVTYRRPGEDDEFQPLTGANLAMFMAEKSAQLQAEFDAATEAVNVALAAYEAAIAP